MPGYRNRSQKVPPTAVAGFEDGHRLVRALLAQLARGTDAGQSCPDDQNIGVYSIGSLVMGCTSRQACRYGSVPESGTRQYHYWTCVERGLVNSGTKAYRDSVPWSTTRGVTIWLVATTDPVRLPPRTADTEAPAGRWLRRRPREIGCRTGQAIRVGVHVAAADLRPRP